MMQVLGVLTIGESPRIDGLARDVQTVVGPEVRVVERGALDGLNRAQIAELAPKPGDYRLITLLRDGTSVEVAKQRILGLLQHQIGALEERDGAAATLLMCTGAFPSFHHRHPLIRPQEALYGVVRGLAGDGSIGAILPLESQIEQGRRQWCELGVTRPRLAAASPYASDAARQIRRAAEALRLDGASILFMDCFGFDLPMKQVAREAFGGPVILARSLAARLAAEIIS